MLLTAADGEPFEMEVAELWRVSDGKVIEVRPYYHDTLALSQRCS